MDRLTYNFRVFLGALALLVLVGLCVHRADAAVIDGTFAMPTKYVDGTDLPIANIKHIQVEVGTCTSVAPAVFGTKEGEHLVAPPALTYAVTVPRAFGNFCARARTVTQLGTIGDYVGPAWVAKVEPKPNPPSLFTVATVVFEAKIHPTYGLVAGRRVGTIALGASCYADANGLPYAGADLYRVLLSAVKLSKTPRSELLMAKCEAG